MSFDENDLYPTVIKKAAALGFSLVQNHPFVDGTNVSDMLRWKSFWF